MILVDLGRQVGTEVRLKTDAKTHRKNSEKLGGARPFVLNQNSDISTHHSSKNGRP